MSQTRNRDGFVEGLEGIRVGAAVLVTAQHALTLTGRDECTMLLGVNLGQLGVALFLGVSGVLAAQSRREPFAWLMQRLIHLAPAYWTVMLLSFVITFFVGYKTFDSWQVLAQLLGIGFWTHRETLVNVPTWFISLLLVCYLGVVAVRVSRFPLGMSLPLMLIFALWAGCEHRPVPIAHFLTFSAAFTLTLSCGFGRRPLVFGIVGGLFLAGACWQTNFAYPGIALCCTGMALGVAWLPRWIRVLAKYSYEYYLLHGVVLAGFVRLFPSHPILAAAAAVTLAFMGAILLQAFVHRVMVWLKPSADPAGQLAALPNYALNK